MANAQEYREQDMVNKVDEIAKSILEKKGSNRYRDKFFPLIIDELDFKVAAEVGVDRGGFSKHLLDNSNLQKLFCIDCWMDNFGSEYRPGEYDPVGENRMKEAMANLSAHNEKTEFIRSFSLDASNEIEDNSLDFCYIDGDHSLEGIYTDIYTWIHKVKKGGILAGHDYKNGGDSGIQDYWGNQLPYLIKTVVDNFGSQYGFKINAVGGRILSWWFLKTV